MKAVIEIDPSVYECGPATESVRELLHDYAAVDWFVPPSAPGEEARRAFARYHERAAAHAADLVGPLPTMELTGGAWADFSRLCREVRADYAWDWKFGVLKPLTQQHSRTFGWAKPEGAPLTSGNPASNAVFLRIGDTVVWSLRLPRLDLSVLEEHRQEAAKFFKGWADFDLCDAIEWQLAEPACALDTNPFTGLLELYRGGYYPFHLTAERVVLFHFRAGGAATTF